jgi:hypothetical protein
MSYRVRGARPPRRAGEQDVGEGRNEEEAVAPGGVADMRGGKAIPKWMSLVFRKVSSIENLRP